LHEIETKDLEINMNSRVSKEKRGTEETNIEKEKESAHCGDVMRE